MPSLKQSRNTLVPWWLLAGDGDAVVSSLAEQVDDAVARVREGLLARFPSYASATAGALDEIGKSRGIRRGRTETDAHYAQRLLRWRYPRGHRVRGLAFALLEQISEYWGGVWAYSIDRRGNQHTRTIAGDMTVTHNDPFPWDDTSAAQWARFWVVVDMRDFASPHPDLGDPALWGGTFGEPGYTYGQTGVTFDDVQAMRDLVRADGLSWKPAGTMPEWLVFMTTGVEPWPNEAWRYWSEVVEDTQVPAREAECRYVSLRPLFNNVYSGRQQFASDVTLADGSLYSGDPTSFPLSTTLPDGSTYAGNSSNFPLSVRLIDDGDPVQA